MGADEYFECIKDINLNILSILGRSYVTDCCVSALKKKREEFLYRSYVTDALQAIAANTAHYVGASGLVEAGVTMRARYADMLHDRNRVSKGNQKKEKTRTAEDVVNSLKDKLKKLGSKKESK